ncbi:MAG: ATP-binding protein [Pyrinomonadaceae bacterium]|nr:ATP-binding protein [Pyrinomonadaceae bacterium]
MKRFDEKVKDIVEVRPFAGMIDFTSSPEATMAGYYFTDGTSALMAKWLDHAARISEQSGAALALAGYRGVGKSHFLAVFGAILAKPELRSKITDSHVSAGMQTLMRRRYPVIQVRRGSKPTLFEEFYDALAAEFGSDAFTIGDSAIPLLEAAAGRTGGLPLVVVVDTASDRGVRVSRDDGALLSELARRGKELNVLFCIALDDDIEGADGSNAAISATFGIDFLDQEHLYKVVNQHVFPKAHNTEPVLGELYEFFRAVVPKFRWSQQRFASLYPLHPGILEVAPYVRLFVHDFALLGFAADAGERILGRPANSLIAFDEVFDKAEPSLRKIEDLQGAFAAYDKLNTDVVSKVPVMQRLQAKLILKAMLLLSLDGRGATAEDICASMLIYDETDPGKVVESVKGIIENFSKALPDDIAVRQYGGGDPHFAFFVSSKDDLNAALQDGIAALPPQTLQAAIRRLMQDRFTDFALTSPTAENVAPHMDCTTVWRGSQRRGRLIWQAGAATHPDSTSSDLYDWEVIIRFGNSSGSENAGPDTVVWRPDPIKPDEAETVLRYHLLQNDASFAERFGEHVRPALHAHRVAAEKIVERIMLDAGNLVIDGFDFNFNDDARSTRTIAGLFSTMLDPLFETRFPNHPLFSQRLGMSEVSRLVSDLYVGSRRTDTEVQQLAETFAEPLGLVRHDGQNYVPENLDSLASRPYIADVLKVIDGSKEIVPLQELYVLLKKAPHGFVRETQHLLLAALVAERKIEFVTSRGDRINHRSLDLRIIWDDIVGVAKTSDHIATSKQLTKWAGILTGDESYKSVDDAAERDRLLTAFRSWLAEWDASNVLGRFEKTTPAWLNTHEWGHAARVRNTLGAVADELRNIVKGTTKLAEGLSRIAATFDDSDAELKRSIEAMRLLASYLDALEVREKVLDYLTAAELTNIEAVENLRETLIIAVEHAVSEPGEAHNREVGYLWERFQREYAEAYASRHDEIMRSHDLQEKYNDIRRSDIWLEYTELSKLPLFQGDIQRVVADLCVQLDQLDCRFDLRRALAHSASCICSFRIDESAKWRDLPSELWGSVTRALDAYRSVLLKRSEHVVPVLQAFSATSKSQEHAASAGRIAKLLADGKALPRLTGSEIQALQIVLALDFDGGRLYSAIAGRDIEPTYTEGVILDHDATEVVVEDAVVVEI